MGPREETKNQGKRFRGKLDREKVRGIEVQEQKEEDKVNVSGEKKKKKSSKKNRE